MHKGVTVYDVMIASPGDVKEERKAIVDAIGRWNSNNLSKYNVILRPRTWEVDAPRGTADDAQSIIDETMIEESDMVIAVFWKTLGRKPKGGKNTYTIGELKKHIEKGKPAIVYFKTPDKVGKTEAETKRIAEVQGFKEKIKNHLKKDCLYGEFDNLSNFRIDSQLDKDITYHLIKNRMPSTATVDQHTGLSEPFSIVSQHHILQYLDATTYRFQKIVKVRANYSGIRQYVDVFRWNAAGILEYRAFNEAGKECKILENYSNTEGWKHYVLGIGSSTVANREYTFIIQRDINQALFRKTQYLIVIANDDDIDLNLELRVPHMKFVDDIKRNRYHYAEETVPCDTDDLKLKEDCSIIYKPSGVKKHEKFVLEWTVK